ncbi:MvaI/BcnI family restriction endonuclease [bacterium]|nr:MvaI/BcnI family restriction endonuclease [bacterium]
MDLKKFTEKFIALKKKGFIPSTRKGPTGIGHTLETYLGLQENNIALPDLVEAEIKAHRSSSSNMITLFTFNRKVWQIPPLKVVKEYGSLDKNGRVGLYYTMSLKPNSAGLFLYVTNKDISVRHISGEVIAVWTLEKLTETFIRKIPALVFVSAFTEERDGREWFHFYRAQLLKGTSPELLANQFKAENILVDLRLHDKGTMARNHGTDFRTYKNKLPQLFMEIRDL